MRTQIIRMRVFSDKDAVLKSSCVLVAMAMSLISKIVQQALVTGYLTVEAEEQLRQLLKTKYDFDDFMAFITLQKEAMEGRVRQESRELLHSSRVSALV
ncbi:hypothetical protein NC996_22005 [Trichocoleus sp. ST-U2]|uniref:hypothetical protein n=2 Tax=Cyanobacteriota TaxID=1117 RepID=UPI0030DA4DC8